MTESLIRPRPRRWGWLIPTCLVAVIWSLVSTIGQTTNIAADADDVRTSYMLGRIFGSVALVGVVMTGVHLLIFLRKRGGELVGRHSAFIFGAAFFGALPALALTFLVSATGGDEATLLAIDAGHTERVEADARKYEAQYEALLGGDVLAPETLMRQRGIDQARANIAAYRELMAEDDASYQAQVEATRAEIEASETSVLFKGQGLTGFDRNTARITREMETLRLLESEILNSWEAVLDFLALRPRRWEAQNGQFSFYREEDLEFFDGHMKRINTLAAQIDSRSAALRASTDRPPNGE